jgi:CBS domain-containing protein/sporulation protein YlmC with PRC-barrel domain
MQYVGEVFISEILKKPVLDQLGKEIGIIKDFSVTAGAVFPNIKSIILKKGGRMLQLPTELIKYLNVRMISATIKAGSITEYDTKKEDILVCRDVLDQQIVDVDGIKVVRVNDIKIAKMKNKLNLIAVDTGLRGLLRRLGFERLADKFLDTIGSKLSDNLLSWNYIQPLEMKLSKLSLTVPKQNISTLHPSDVAQLISEVSRDDKETLFSSLDVDVAAEALHELEPRLQASIITHLDKKSAKELLNRMPPDEAADVLGDIPKPMADELLNLMEKEEAEDVIELLEHDDDTAGGLMTTEYITLTPDLTAADSLKEWRLQAPDVEAVYTLYVTDKKEKLLGLVTLKELMLAKSSATVSSLMKPPIKTLSASEGKMQAATIISKYNIFSVPVIDDNETLLGIVTVDDIVDILLPPESRKKKHIIK